MRNIDSLVHTLHPYIKKRWALLMTSSRVYATGASGTGSWFSPYLSYNSTNSSIYFFLGVQNIICQIMFNKKKKVIIIIQLPFKALPGALCKFFLLQFAQKHAMENICVHNALCLQIYYIWLNCSRTLCRLLHWKFLSSSHVRIVEVIDVRRIYYQ